MMHGRCFRPYLAHAVIIIINIGLQLFTPHEQSMLSTQHIPYNHCMLGRRPPFKIMLEGSAGASLILLVDVCEEKVMVGEACLLTN